MQPQNGTKENATSNTQNNAEETLNNGYLAENRQIENTPFVLRRREKGYFLTIGDTRITEPTETEQETLNRLKEEKWIIIAAMIVHVVKILKENDIVTHHKVTDSL